MHRVEDNIDWIRRLSAKTQDTNRHIQGLLAVEALAMLPEIDNVLGSIHTSDFLVITAMDCLGRSAPNILDLAQELRERNTGLHVLNRGGDADAETPMGSMIFIGMSAPAQMEQEI